jgi:FAD/FMN-containing dehydrogenase
MLATAERFIVNDVHSQLNATSVEAVVRPRSIEELQAVVLAARERRAKVSIAGGRHSMGGQQFGAATVLIDMTAMDRILSLDAGAGLLTVEAGIMWPALIDGLIRRQAGRLLPWGIIQKQTGADRLTIGGSLGSNIHGRGLTLRPFVDDVEAFTLVDADGCAALQPGGAPRAVPAGDRRVRTVRARRDGHAAAPAATQDAAARGRALDRRAHGPVRPPDR